MAWSYAVARTICADRLRLRARKVEIPIERERLEASAAAAHSGEERAVGAALQARLARLSECLRAAYVLVKVEGLSCAEAANLLGTTPSAVKQRVHRANAELRAELRAGESRPFVVRRNGDERCTNA